MLGKWNIRVMQGWALAEQGRPTYPHTAGPFLEFFLLCPLWEQEVNGSSGWVSALHGMEVAAPASSLYQPWLLWAS